MHVSKSDLKIDWATHAAAKYACENWHYSGCLPAGKLVKVGAWENGKFIGVVLFGRGASPFLGKKYNLPQNHCVELVRVALTNHKIQVSRIVSIAIKFLQKANSDLRLIVSFADPDKGHHGGIYQAGNWLFCGSSSATTELFIKGRWVHMRGGYYAKTNATPQRTMPGKLRYLMPLDDEMRKQIEPLRKPYPKRVRSVDSDTATVQVAEGGATPTRTL
jgi:hypothetical protein